MTEEQIDRIFDKIKEIKGLKTNEDVAKLLKKTSNYVSYCKKRGTIDASRIMQALPDADFNYIFKANSTSQIAKSENQNCQKCKGKDLVIESLKEQLSEYRKDLIRLGSQRVSQEPQEAPQTSRERERELNTARGRR